MEPPLSALGGPVWHSSVMASPSADCLDAGALDDIEDLIATADDAPVVRMERSEVAASIESRQRRRKRQEVKTLLEDTTSSQESTNANTPTEVANEAQKVDSSDPLLTNAPGLAKVYVKTWGCAHNNSDGEYMAGLLSEYGYNVVIEEDEGKDADVWLLNSCTVKGPAEAHFVTSISEAQKSGKKVVVAGCVPQAWGGSKSGKESERRANAQELSVIGVQQIDRVVEVVEETLAGNMVRLMGTKTAKVAQNKPDKEESQKMTKIKLGGAPLDLPKIRRNPLIEIVPISTGCLNACTYCKTKHARGHLGSYPIDQIVSRIQQVVSEGVLEIWLTSEDTGAYGIDIDTDITQLLWRILEVLPEPVMLRMGMTNPPYIKRHALEMAKIYTHPRIYAYLHLPIQSASDAVLDSMKREYTRKDFEQVVDQLKSVVPHLNIATDLIIGFPGETHEDYQQTYDLVMKYKFASLFINQFYPRPGTPAAKMKRVNTQVVKERTRELSTWFKAYMPYDGRVGETHKILVTEMAPDGRHVAGRTKSYEMVLVDSEIALERLMGRVVEVTITETGKFFLKGKPTAAGVLALDSQQLPSESVLRRRTRTPGPAKKFAASEQRERLDYHEGDDGEDIDENDWSDGETADSGCGDCGDGDCCNTKSGDCGDCGAPHTAASSQPTPNSSAKSTPIEIGPSQKLRRKADSPVAPETSGSMNQKLLALVTLLVAICLINYPLFKAYLPI